MFVFRIFKFNACFVYYCNFIKLVIASFTVDYYFYYFSTRTASRYVYHNDLDNVYHICEEYAFTKYRGNITSLIQQR